MVCRLCCEVVGAPSVRALHVQRNAIGSHGTTQHISNDDTNDASSDGFKSRRTTTNLLGDNVAQTKQTFLKTTSKVHPVSSGLTHPKPSVNKEIDTMISGMAPALLLGQCFSLMGMSNVACQQGRDPYFRWLSLRMLFSTVTASLLLVTSILVISFYIQNNVVTTVAAQTFLFYLSSFVVSCLFIHLASQWTSLCATFQNLEKRLSLYGNSSGLERRMRAITAAVLILALVEHCVAQTNTFFLIKSNPSNNSEQEWLEGYYETQFKYVRFHFPYSLLMVAFTVTVNTTATFIWHYNDLFIMLISVAVASRFQLLYDNLQVTAEKDKDVKTWRHFRETFNAISSLTQMVEDRLSLNVLLSFVNNFIFICFQLLHTVRFSRNTAFESFYYAFSLASLVVRAVSVSLCAASIYEKSGAIKKLLFSTSSKEYCVEVERLIHQVSFDDIALTGCNFFSVTRSLLLTVFGTVATYEIVLVQFNSLNSNL